MKVKILVITVMVIVVSISVVSGESSCSVSFPNMVGNVLFSDDAAFVVSVETDVAKELTVKYTIGDIWRNDVNMPSRTPGAVSTTRVSDVQYMRPCMYLSKDFFKDVKLVVSSMGSEIKQILLKNYTKSELMNGAGYTQEELLEIGFQ